MYDLNPWWERRFDFPGLRRDRYLQGMESNLSQGNIQFLIGLRRVGKTTIIKQFIYERLKQNEPEKILYVSMDHPAFERISLLDILTQYRKLHGIKKEEKIFAFFDEVHQKKGFERDLKAIYDHDPSVSIFASGSSSLLLRQKSSYLTGRFKKTIVHPLDFKEYLVFNDLDIKKSEEYLGEKYLEEYMVTGGMPEYVIHRDPQYILDMLESIIYKDIASRYHIKDPLVLKDLLLLLSERCGNRLTFNKISKILGVSVEMARQYISYFEETMLISIAYRFGGSNVRIYSPRKIYFADNGIKSLISPGSVGQLAENLAYNGIINGDIFYFQENGKEIDFVGKDYAYEVKYKDEINKDEISTLISLKRFKQKFVLTKGYEGKKGNVIFIPLWKYLLNGTNNY